MLSLKSTPLLCAGLSYKYALFCSFYWMGRWAVCFGFVPSLFIHDITVLLNFFRSSIQHSVFLIAIPCAGFTRKLNYTVYDTPVGFCLGKMDTHACHPVHCIAFHAPKTRESCLCHAVLRTNSMLMMRPSSFTN